MNGLYDELLIAAHGIWRRRWTALAVAWGVAVLGWLVVSLIPSRYESDARLLIQASSLLPDKVGITSQDRQQSIETVRQTLTSVSNLQKVVRGTDLALQTRNEADVTAKAQALATNIKIVAEGDNLFQITASSADTSLSDAKNAKLARQIVQKLIDMFVDGSLSGGRVETGQTIKFLDTQLAQRGKELADVTAKRAEFEAKYMSLLPGAGTIDQRIEAARLEITRIDGDLAAAQASASAMQSQLASTPASIRTPGTLVGGSPGVNVSGAIQAQIAEAQARGWTDEHPDMVALRGQLARARAQDRAAVAPHMTAGTSAPNPAWLSLRSMAAEKQALASSLASRKAQLQSQINGVIAAQTANPELAAQATQLDRDYTVKKAQYDKLLADREDIILRGQVQTQTDAMKFSVIDPPSAPTAPASPNRPLLLTLVLLASLVAGAGTAFVLNQLRHTYPTATRLAHASGLPVIGSVGEVVSGNERDRRAKKLRLFIGGTAALAGVYVLLLVVEFINRSMVA